MSMEKPPVYVQKHINSVKPGDAVLHNGREQTVSKSDIRWSSFMGRSIFGDSYCHGHQQVMVRVFDTPRIPLQPRDANAPEQLPDPS